ncbi:MAG TPA: hypothetical protein VEF76_12705 [Patescibacteria group bacterium]|nr:hypothetical protein [Patescibacteria group bacterium]
MNAGIVILRDGTPCIAYDNKLPYPIKHIEFSRETFQLTLVYNVPGVSKISGRKQGHTFEYPLDHAFVLNLEEKGMCGVAAMGAKDLLEIKLYSVVFTAY